MSLKQDLQNVHNKLDKYQRRFAAAKKRDDPLAAATAQIEIEKITQQLNALKGQQDTDTSKKVEKIEALAFKRELTNSEQADLGKLKKSVKGLITVHPLTHIGKKLGIQKMTGFAPKEF